MKLLPLAALLLTSPAWAANEDRLPDGETTTGQGRIAAAWLVGPTDRYRHGVLGDAIEAGGLAVRLDDGRELRVDLPPDQVFEDRMPRLHDDRIVLVRSGMTTGASVTLWGVERDELRLLAESAPFGRPNRWLNPVGVADFDGDGQEEIAAVVTPHLSGVLTLYRRDGARLEKVFEAAGYSNHRIGSRDLSWAVVHDFDGDGVVDIGVPGIDHETYHLLSLRGGFLRALALSVLPGQVQAVEGVVDGPGVAVRAGGRLVVVRP